MHPRPMANLCDIGRAERAGHDNHGETGRDDPRQVRPCQPGGKTE